MECTWKWPAPGRSKLATSLVNVSLKFQTSISQICQIFFWKKREKLLQCESFSHFFNKNISVFGYKALKHLTSWPLNELVKLTTLWTTGPRSVLSAGLVIQVSGVSHCLVHHVFGNTIITDQGKSWSHWFSIISCFLVFFLFYLFCLLLSVVWVVGRKILRNRLN